MRAAGIRYLAICRNDFRNDFSIALRRERCRDGMQFNANLDLSFAAIMLSFESAVIGDSAAATIREFQASR